MATPPLTILTGDSPAAIRAAIDQSLDASTLPESLIYSAPFGPAAEDEVLRREAQVLPSAIDPVKQAAHREQAAIYLAAARLAQSLPALVEQTLGDSSYRRNGFDPEKRHASLRSLAERELSAYLVSGGYQAPYQQFWLGKGRRGR